MLSKLILFIAFLTSGYIDPIYAAEAAVRIPDWLMHSSTTQANCRWFLTEAAPAQNHIFDYNDRSAFQRLRKLLPKLEDADVNFLEQLSWKSVTQGDGVESIMGLLEGDVGFGSEVPYYSRASLNVEVADSGVGTLRSTFKLTFRRPNSLLGFGYEREFTGFCDKVGTVIYPVICDEQKIGTDRVFTIEMPLQKLRSDILLKLKVLLHGLHMNAQPMIFFPAQSR